MLHGIQRAEGLIDYRCVWRKFASFLGLLVFEAFFSRELFRTSWPIVDFLMSAGLRASFRPQKMLAVKRWNKADVTDETQRVSERSPSSYTFVFPKILTIGYFGEYRQMKALYWLYRHERGINLVI